MKNLFYFFLLIPSFLFAQEIKFWGEAKPGNIIIGKADNLTSVLLNNKNVLFSKSGYFIFGFDKEDEGLFVLKVKQKNKKLEKFEYVLEPTEYGKQELTFAKKMINPPKKYLKKIKNEAAQMKTARNKMLKNKKSYYSSGFKIPVDSVRITSEFGLDRILNGQAKNFHNGIDFGGTVGTPVYAIADGIVRLAGKNFYFNGNFVLIDHGQGLSSVYLHFSKLNVKTGDKVSKGDIIGEIGATGRATGPHLHLGVQWYKKRIDPTNLLNLKFE